MCNNIGKTTQIPQYILEDAPKDAKIIVAQPRRLAATGVADRVADERGESQPGIGSVGYVVRGDSKISNDCRLMFCTTGVLLRQLQSEGALECITHIVIDEVHERHLDTDILLGILKETRPPHLRVVLMSGKADHHSSMCTYAVDHFLTLSCFSNNGRRQICSVLGGKYTSYAHPWIYPSCERFFVGRCARNDRIRSTKEWEEKEKRELE